jgi:hypothetical protein
MVCRNCHEAIHAGKPTRQPQRNESLESRGARKRAARFGERRLKKGQPQVETSSAVYSTYRWS